MDGPHPVIEGLRRTLAASRSSVAFVDEMEGRIRQLLADMVDGRVLPKGEAEGLRASLIELVRTEALAKYAGQTSDALRVLDTLKAYGYTQLEGARVPLEIARAAKFPPPQPAAWPELADLRAAASRHPSVCSIAAPVRSVYFADELAEDGLPLPDELLALYAWADGFDLSCMVATHVPVFSLLPGQSIDVSDAEAGYPRRAVVFQGGDEVQFSMYRDQKNQWWLVYEHEYQPIGKKALDLRSVIQFGLRRMNAPTADALYGELSWDRFFDIARS
jgi:hypothetical protein